MLYVAAYNKKYLVAVLPIMPFSGLFYSDIEVLNPYHFMVAGLPEFVFLIAIALGEKIRGIVSISLLIAPLSALPSLLQAGDQVYMSIYFIVMLSMCAFLYQSQFRQMGYIIGNNIVELSLAVMVCVGIIGKLYTVYITEADSSLPYLLAFFMARDGAIAGSNFISQLILTLLPISRNKIISSVAIGLLLITFSRGAYLCLTIYFIWNFLVSKKKLETLKIVSCLFILSALLLSFVKSDIIDSTTDFAKERIVSHETSDVESRYQNEERFKIFSDALEIARNSHYLGVGLGGFYYAHRDLRDSNAEYYVSNAHNLYLTIIAEGGGLPLILFAIGLVTSFFCALRIKNCGAPLAVLLLSVYFLFSGSIYESSRYVTLAPYCLWVFLLAYINYMRKIYVKAG